MKFSSFFSVLKYLFCESLQSLYNDNDISKSLSWKSVHANSLVRKCGDPGNLNSSPFTCKTETVLVLKWVTANTFLQMFHTMLLAATTEINTGSVLMHCLAFSIVFPHSYAVQSASNVVPHYPFCIYQYCI